MWWLIALRGLRRGEAAGLRWIDVDLDEKVIMINQQCITFGHTTTVGPPKTAASRRTIALDRTSVKVLRAHRQLQMQEAARAGEDWVESGYVFTNADGSPLNPDYLTRRFRYLVGQSGLPPVRLHDLRHGAATLAHAAGADLKTVQEQTRAHVDRAHRRHLHERAHDPSLQDRRGHRAARARRRV
jgi:integrase